jgi:N-acetylglutamate synthase-like GNAT family acetyltransferase
VPVLRTAVAADLAACRALLERCELPRVGLERDFPVHFVIADDGPQLVGCAGVEDHAGVGLLRSVAVAPTWRRHGLGAQLVADRLAHARARRLTALWLLTTTAAEYFSRLGFVAVPRDAVPPSIQQSDEFTLCCPASAICMVHRLVAPP